MLQVRASLGPIAAQVGYADYHGVLAALTHNLSETGDRAAVVRVSLLFLRVNSSKLGFAHSYSGWLRSNEINIPDSTEYAH